VRPAETVVGIVLTRDRFVLVQGAIGQSHSCQRSEGDCHYGHGASSGAETLCGSLRVYRGPAGRTRVSTVFVLTVRQPVAGWWGYPQGCELNLDPPIRLMARGSLGFECERGARAGSSVPVSHRSLPHR